MFAALGRLAYRRRKLIVVLWSLAFAAGLVASLSIAAQLKGGGFTNPGSPSQRGQREMQERLGFGPASLTIVFSSDTLSARSPVFQARVREVLAGVEDAGLEGLTAVRTAQSTGDAGFISRDGRATFAVLEFDGTSEEVQAQIPALRRTLKSTGLTVYLTGDPAVYAEIEQRSAEDLRTAESYTIPVAIFVLVLIFGTLVAAALPVIGGGMAVTVTLGLFWLLAQVVDISVFALNVATLLGLAVGIDYALFMVGRFREELAAGHDVADAVETTVAHAGRSIFFSGITVVVGLLGLMIIPYMSMRSMGLGGALVVLVSVLAALTLLPALLGLLGPKVNSLRVIGRKNGDELFWGRWSDWVMRHPVPVLVGTIALVAVFAWPVLGIESEIPGATALPRDSESRQGYDLLQERFDVAALSPIEVLVTWNGEQDPFAPANLERLYAYGQELAALSGVDRVTSIVTLPGMESADGAAAFWRGVEAASSTSSPEDAAPQTAQPGLPGIIQGMLGAEQVKAAQKLAAATTAPGTTLLRVVPEQPPTSKGAQALAVDILEAGGPPEATTYVAGASLTVYDFVDAIYSRFPWIIAFVVGVTGLVLFLMLRSVVLPVKAVIMNVCSLLAGYGAMVWIFQEGHLERLFQFTATGAIDAELPVILFCTVFGVSMDYEVFLLSRMREEWDATHDNVRAVSFGLARTGRIVTSAALIIVVVGLSFAFTSIVVTKAIGIGLAVAVAFDATVIRVLMVPAAMRLLGRWNWWLPRWLSRLPRIE
ncbi:MAG TPA: MMPL family transporter [Thermoleophilia bacterium]|nr:MMPL family transporter [Thermoleophilia bacterium]